MASVSPQTGLPAQLIVIVLKLPLEFEIVTVTVSVTVVGIKEETVVVVTDRRGSELRELNAYPAKAATMIAMIKTMAKV